MLKLVVTDSAVEDLQAIRQYITEELFAPEAATKLIRTIIERYEKLPDFPESAPIMQDTENILGYRELAIRNNYVYYRFDDKNLYIVRILGQRQNSIKHLY
jgi:addiction module RelE/StbE family toxin